MEVISSIGRKLFYRRFNYLDVIALTLTGVTIHILSEFVRLSGTPSYRDFLIELGIWIVAYGIGVSIANAGSAENIPRILAGLLVGSSLAFLLIWLKSQLFDTEMKTFRVEPVTEAEAQFHKKAFVFLMLFYMTSTLITTTITGVLYGTFMQRKTETPG